MPKIYIEKITSELYLLRCDDDQTKYFEATWYISEGITYNSYLLILKDKKILFDGWKYTYGQEFLEALSRLINPKDLDCIVVHHAEPDHSGTIAKVLELKKNILVLGHPLAKELLEKQYDIKLNFRSLCDGEELVVGNKKLKFFHTPWLHWPETIMTYISEDNLLLSGDVFGGYSLPSIFDDDEKMISQYLSFSRKYLVNVIGHYRQHVIKNIEKLGNLKIKILAPLHGLVWRNTPQKIINCYFNWAKGIPEKGKIVVVFGSMYGFMEEAIGFLVQILQEQGYRTLVFKFTDKAYDSLSDALGEIVDSEGLVLGCSIYENEIFPYMRYFLSLLLEKVDVQKPVLVVTSYGWSRVARKKIEEIFAHTNFKIVEIVDFKGKLNGEIEKSINCALEKFISSLT